MGDEEKRRWQVRRDLAYRQLVDGGMIYDRRLKRVHHLNATAACMWEVCMERGTTGDIVREICRRYEVESEQARADVAKGLREFEIAGLLFPC